MVAVSVQNAWFLTGPTASGKSAVGVELARQIDAEIVSMDSIALYRGMDIGTAKPTCEQRHAVPHHLIDVLDPWRNSVSPSTLNPQAKSRPKSPAAGGSSVRRRNAAVSERPAAGNIPGAAGRLGIAPPLGRRRQTQCRRLAARASGRRRSRCGISVASERRPPTYPRSRFSRRPANRSANCSSSSR